MSLDKVESSNPNLTAVHAGASTRKTRHLQPHASNAADAEGGLFCLFRLASHIRVLSKSGEKPALHSKTTKFSPFICHLHVLYYADVICDVEDVKFEQCW